MTWFYDLLTTSGVNADAASWATAALAVLLVYAVVSIFKSLCK